ncbi:hypothetical protein TrRE_jg8835 [Triparma retinervis]|uniref:Uncharacterized protein n=1 Tax=Triparma retinervis TaxID=2557542 RepID=A0A9W7DK85_9STRA|nr:hypothetical protein TrRE_jg8835 [Triparma retinervis]
MPRDHDEYDSDGGSPTRGTPQAIPTNMRGYQQVYLIKKPNPKTSDAYSGEREVLFRCGNWCYVGRVTLDFGGAEGPDDDDESDSEGRDMSLKDIPRVIPILQRQQGKLAFYCNHDSVPRDSSFYEPLETMQEAQDFLAGEFISDEFNDSLDRFEQMYPWMNDDEIKSYFELNANFENEPMENIQCICSKTYARGLIFVTIYYENTFYVTISEGSGDQPLLDVRFPDVSNHGEGVTLMSYIDNDIEARFQKLTLWQSLAGEMKLSTLLAPRVKKTKNLASDSYVQSYIVMKPNKDEGNETFRTALFRFGSWCYSGRVQLTASLALADLPHVIPALRMQQSRLEFLCDVSAMPSRSPFVRPMEFAQKAAGVMEEEVVASEDVLNNLVERLSSMGLGDSISQWLEGDPSQSFFEFSFASTPDTDKAHKNVELMCTKSYTPNGLVTICIYFGGVYYLSLQEGGGEQPLLDSKFPNVAGKGRGYQIRSYSSGVEGWDSLRKVSIWQTQSAMQEEMEARIDKAADAEAKSGTSFGSAVLITEARNAKMVDDELGMSYSVDAGAGVAEAKDLGMGSIESKMGTVGAGGSEPSTPTAESAGAGVTSPTREIEAAAESKMEGEASAQSPERTVQKSPAKAVDEDSRGGAASPAAGGPAGGSEAKKSPDGQQGASDNRKQSLGAFHHLAPMRKPSGLEGKLGDIRKGMGGGLGAVGGGGNKAPWDPFGKPVLGKGKLESKPL